MNHAADISSGPGAGLVVVLRALGLLSASVALLIVVGLQKDVLAGVLTLLSALTLLSTGGLVYFSIRMVWRFERARDKEQLAHHYLQEAIDTLPTGLAIYDAQDRLVVFNRAAAELYPYRAGEDLIGHSYETLVRRALDAGQILDAIGREETWLSQRMLARGHRVGPQLCQTTDGRWMQFHEIRTPSGFLVMERNEVTSLIQKNMALMQTNEKLAHLSSTDPLTGLSNRRMFDQCLYAEWQRSARSQLPLSLLMVDIDHFKRYNDHYGHLAGDACLRKIASILFDCSQRTGEVVARYGGEEFSLLLPGTNSQEAQSIAQRCMDELERTQIPHANSPNAQILTLSMGVATVVAEPQVAPESLINAADVALYRAKGSGRSRFELATVSELSASL
jgi:diguanylate cyclase (GGDEF)-like protein